MPASPLRNELLVQSGRLGEVERLVLLPMLPPLDSPTNWFPQQSSSLPSPTTTLQIFRKPVPEAKVPITDHILSSANSDFSQASLPRGRSFSSECSDTPSMVVDCGSDRSEIDRDEDHYHEKVARELDVWHSNEHIHALTMYFSKPPPTPFPPPSTPPLQPDELFITKMEESPISSSSSGSSSQLQHNRHSPNKSVSSTPTMRALQTTARPRSSTIGSQPIIQKARSTLKSTSHSPPSPRPSRPAPMPGRTPTLQPSVFSQPSYPPPIPPKPSNYHLSQRSERGKKNHLTLPGRNQPATLSLYPSPTTTPPTIPLPSPPSHHQRSQLSQSQVSQPQQPQSFSQPQRLEEAPPRPRQTKSTPHLRSKPTVSLFPPLHNSKFFAPSVPHVSAAANSSVASPPATAPVSAPSPVFGARAKSRARGVETPSSSTFKFQFASPASPSLPAHYTSLNASSPLNLPRSWPLNEIDRFTQEKSVWEEDEDEAEGRGEIVEEGLLGGVRRKVRRRGGSNGWGGSGHRRNGSGGGSGSEKENERERKKEREKEEGREVLGERRRRKLRKSAGEIVKGLFRKGSS